MDITLTSFSVEYNDAEVSDSAWKIEVITAGSFTLIYAVPKIAAAIMTNNGHRLGKANTRTGCLNDASEQVIFQMRHSGSIDRLTNDDDDECVPRGRESSQFTRYTYPKATIVLNKGEATQATGHCHYWSTVCLLMLLLLMRVEGAPHRAVRDGTRGGGGGGGGLIVLSRKILGHPGEREDYQEINSKTGLALLTSQGSTVRGPHGSGCQCRLVLLRI